MNKPISPGLTKTCMNCGLQKPLSAFLEMSSADGKIYGNICSSCRKTALEELERRKKTDAEGSTTTESGHKIDAKTKIQGEIDKREQFQRTEDEYHAERDEADKKETSKHEAQFNIATGEKKHRDSFLKRSTLLGTNQSTADKPSAAQQLRTTMLHGNEQTQKAAADQFKEGLKTGLDLTKPHHSPQVTGQQRYLFGVAFKSLLTRLGTSAPISSNLNRTDKKPAAKEAGSNTDPTAKTKSTSEKEKAKDPAVKYIEENWRKGPGSKR